MGASSSSPAVDRDGLAQSSKWIHLRATQDGVPFGLSGPFWIIFPPAAGVYDNALAPAIRLLVVIR